MLHVTSSVFVPAESAWDFRDTTASDPKGVLEVSIGLVTAPPQDVHGDLVNGAPRPEREISFAASSSSSKRWAVFPLTSPVRPDQRKGAECLLLFLLWKGSCFGFQGSPGRKPAGRRRCYSRRFHPRIPPTSPFIHQLGRSRWRIDTELFQTLTTDCHLKHPAVHQSNALVLLTMIRLLAYT